MFIEGHKQVGLYTNPNQSIKINITTRLKTIHKGMSF